MSVFVLWVMGFRRIMIFGCNLIFHRCCVCYISFGCWESVGTGVEISVFSHEIPFMSVLG